MTRDAYTAASDAISERLHRLADLVVAAGGATAYHADHAGAALRRLADRVDHHTDQLNRSHGPFDLGGALYPGPLSVVNMTGRTRPVVTSDVVDRTADQMFPPPAEEAPTVTRTVPFVDWLLVAGIVTAGLASVAIAELRHRYHRRDPR